MATTGDPWQHQRVLQYIKTNGFGTITLQFPDELLQHATTVAQELQQLLRKEGSAAKVEDPAAYAHCEPVPVTLS